MYALLFLLIAMLTAGCTQDVALYSPEGTLLGQATLNIDDNDTNKVTLIKNGEIYSGKWTETRVDESAAIAARYGVGSRKYQDYKRGWSPEKHVGKATLVSESNISMRCSFSIRGTSGQGQCLTDTEKFTILARE